MNEIMNVDFDRNYDMSRLTEEEREYAKDGSLGWADYQRDDLLKKLGKNYNELNSFQRDLLNHAYPNEYKILIKFPW